MSKIFSFNSIASKHMKFKIERITRPIQQSTLMVGEFNVDFSVNDRSVTVRNESWCALSHVWPSVVPWTVAHQAPLPTWFSRPTWFTEVGCHFLLHMTCFLISFKKGKWCINEDKAVVQISSGTDYLKTSSAKIITVHIYF